MSELLTTFTPPPSKLARKTEEKIRAYHRHTNTTRALLLEQIAVFDENDFCMRYGAISTASWLAREFNYADPTAYEYVRVARKLRIFPLLAAAFKEGRIDYTTVRYLVRYLTEENEAELVELATTLCHAELKLALAGADPEDNSEDEDNAPDTPYLRTHTREDGMLRGEFLLPAVAGEEFLAALKIAELAANGITEEAPEELDPEPPAETEEACPAVMVEGPREDSKLTVEKILNLPSRFGPPLKDRMYDAFITLVNMVRATPASPLRAPGANVAIVCTEDGRAWMPQNPQAPSRVIRGYVANAIARGHLLDSAGLTLFVGRQRRLATDGQVAALLAVWGNQCAMPGCTHSRFIEIHHIHEWAEGGETDIDNLIPLCSSCHSKVTHGLAHIAITGGEIEFRFIDGSRYLTQNRCLPRRATDFEGPLLGYRQASDLCFA